jgi:hypothetical protein
MAFKKIDPKLTFAEIAFASSMEKNRSLDVLMNMNPVIDWSKIEKLLLKHYKIGKRTEGADAYPPLMSRRSFYKSGSVFPLILSWKTKSTTGSHLKNS